MHLHLPVHCLSELFSLLCLRAQVLNWQCFTYSQWPSLVLLCIIEIRIILASPVTIAPQVQKILRAHRDDNSLLEDTERQRQRVMAAMGDDDVHDILEDAGGAEQPAQSVVSPRSSAQSVVSPRSSVGARANSLEEALREGKWTMSREKRHRVYRRMAFMDDFTSITQTFTIASTPSDRRSERNALAKLRQQDIGVRHIAKIDGEDMEGLDTLWRAITTKHKEENDIATQIAQLMQRQEDLKEEIRNDEEVMADFYDVN